MNRQIISDCMSTAVSDQIFPGAVLFCAQSDKILYHEAFGLSDIYKNTPVQKDSIFDLASLTKPLATGLAIATLIQEKKLYLDQTVSDILLDYKNTDKADLTIDMLLRHTSGLPPYKEYYKDLIKHEANDRINILMQFILNEPLVQIPGKIQDYSDLGFIILGRIIEKLTGSDLQVYVASLYRRLNCSHLFYIPLALKAQYIKDYGSKIVSTQRCPWRKKLMVGETDDDNTWAIGGVAGHAGLFGDANSIFKICKEILNALTGKPTKFINPDVLIEMSTRKDGHDMVAGFDSPSKTRSSAGKYFSSRSVGHLGFTGTSFWIDPLTDLIVILLTNRVHPTRSNEMIKTFRPELHNLVYEQLI